MLTITVIISLLKCKWQEAQVLPSLWVPCIALPQEALVPEAICDCYGES